MELSAPFLKAGLESNEVCVWVIAEPLTEKDAWAALGDAVPALDRYRADRRIEVLLSQTWYVTGDSPDLQKVARGWEAKLADALGRGYEGLRVVASALQLEEKHWADFLTESLPLGQVDACPVRLSPPRTSRSRCNAYSSVDHQEARRRMGGALMSLAE